MKEIKDFIEEYVKLLPVPNKGVNASEAERRAGKFLEALAILADCRHTFTEAKIGQLSVQSAVYSEQMAKGTGKTMTENKTNAEASPEYIAAREALETTENDISYLKAYQDIFNNAHIFYRALAKTESSGF